MKAGGTPSPYRLGIVGASLGMLAGIIQWSLGAEIPEWTGNKLHPEQLGLITIALSLLAFGSVRALWLKPGLSGTRRGAAILLVLACAGICFTTVGALWFVPGPLLLISLAGYWRRRPATPGGLPG